MGKIFNINRKHRGTEPKDSGLTDFENDIVSLDETGSIELPDDASAAEDYDDRYEDYDEDYDEAADETGEVYDETDEAADEFDEIEELEEVAETGDAEDYDEVSDDTVETEESEYYEDDYDEVSDETGTIDEVSDGAEDYDEVSDDAVEAEESEYYEDDYDEVPDETGTIDEISDGAEDYDEVPDETGVIDDIEGASAVRGSLEEIEYPEEVSEYDDYSDEDYKSDDDSYDDSYEEGSYEDEAPESLIRDDDPTLGFDEVRLDTATINAADLAAYVKGSRIRELRQSGAYSENVGDMDTASENEVAIERAASAGESSYGKASGKRASEKSTSGRGRSDRKSQEAESYDEPDQDLGSDEYVNLDAPHDRPIEAPGTEKNNILKILVIAAACIALLAVAAFGIRQLMHRGGGAAGSAVRVNDAGLPVADELIGVGNELGSIDSIGRAGIEAAINARMSGGTQVVDVPVPDTTITPHSDYNETEIVVSTRVSIELITVKSDLKIRFINADTGKLIPNIPFQVVVTDPSGKTLNWTDDDLDGIIYKTSISEGKYKVHVEPLSGDKYSDYSWPSDNNVTVKSTIDYAKVDVGDEVKDASQVNENAEDTASRGNTSELDPNNTVEFVESSVSPMYTEISKDTITNPLAALTLQEPGGIVLVTENSVSGNGTVSGNGDVSGNSGSGGNSEGGNSSSDGSEGGNTGSVSGNDVSGNTTQPAPKPEVSVTVSPATLSLKTGATGTFTFSYSLTNVDKADKIDVVSSNTSVATASVSDKTVTVTAVGGGTCDITVTITTAKTDKITETATASAKCTVTVTNVDMTQTLKDKSGNEVYVFENNAYRIATFADYAKFDKFYIVTGTKYTGWQNLNGSTYYYDANGKVVTGTQVIQGVTYMFAADGKMTSTSGVLGIDVSKWNGNIDWAAVKASGVDYVIIRVGYRGSTAGALIDDSRFIANINGAKGAGLKVGVYFVTQAVNDVEAVYEASMVLDRIKGYSLDLPVFLDVEPSGGRGDRIDKATRTSVIIAFCETIRSAGYSAGVYANKTWLDTKMDASQLGNYKIWVAHYSSVCGYTGRYDMWQYTDKGTISGITGSVDLNLRYS